MNWLNRNKTFIKLLYKLCNNLSSKRNKEPNNVHIGSKVKIYHPEGYTRSFMTMYAGGKLMRLHLC